MISDKLTIVLLPGLHGTKGLFQPLIDAAPDTFNILTIEYPRHEKKSYTQLIPLVKDKLLEIKGSYVLIGESFGGPLSIFISSTKPKGLIGTILVATFITAPNIEIGRFLPWTLGFALTRPLYALKLMFSNRENGDLIALVSAELQKVSSAVLAARVDAVYTVDATTQLVECVVPLAYFRGSHDLVVPQYNLKSMLAVKPDIKVVQFDTDHLLLQNAPAEAWQAISTFVSDL